MIVLYIIAAYLTLACVLGRRLRRQRELALYGRVVVTARDEQLDIKPALRRSR